MNTYNLRLDLSKDPLYTRPNEAGGVTLRQGDRSGCTIVADLYDHGERFTTSGLSAYFVMDLPDHAHYYREQATYSAGTVSVTVDERYAASVAGWTDNAYFELLQGGTVIASTQSFRVHVLADARAGHTAGETYDSAISELMGDLADAIAAAEAATGSVETAIDNADAAAERANAAAAHMGYNAYLDWDEEGGTKYLSIYLPD